MRPSPKIKAPGPHRRRVWAAAGLAAAGLLATACSPLTAFNTLAPRDAARRAVEGIAYGELPRQTLDVYTPRASAQTAGAPVLVFFYGGSWKSGRRQDYAFVGHALAAQGFVTVIPDYRLYPEVRFPAFLQDGAAAVRWAQDNAARFGGDPSRIVLAGHSAGAYNAAMQALDPQWTAAAGVRPGAVKAFAGLSGPYDFLPLDTKVTRDTFGQASDLPATQPTAFARPGAPAAFLAHGLKDDLVYPKNSRALARVLEAEGVAVEAAYYADVDHAGTLLALSRPLRGRAPVLETMSAFLKQRSVP